MKGRKVRSREWKKRTPQTFDIDNPLQAASAAETQVTHIDIELRSSSISIIHNKQKSAKIHNIYMLRQLKIENDGKALKQEVLQSIEGQKCLLKKKKIGN
jgi:hypothetical protein